VVRLDPRTLAILATARVLPSSQMQGSGSSLSAPALGLGSLWVMAGNEAKLELVRMDPVSMAILGRTRVPTGGSLPQALNHVIADATHVYVAGSAFVPVDGTGQLQGHPVQVPGLQSVEIWGDDLVGITYDGTAFSLVIVDPQGKVLARTELADAGASSVVSGDDVWFEGNAGHGDGIVHVRLIPRG